MTMKALFAFMMLTVFGCTYGQASLSLDISENIVHPGTDIILNCRVEGIDAGTLVYWYKAVMKVGGPDPMQLGGGEFREMEEVVERIATNDVLENFYKNLGRYSATKSNVGDVFLFILNIHNVTDEDSGHIGCAVPTEDNVFDTQFLEVYEAPTNISFVDYMDAGNITFVEDQPQNVSCVTGPSLPTPHVTLSVGHGHNFRDITRSFIRHTKLNVNCPESVGDSKKKCPLNMDYDVILKSSHWQPKFEDEGLYLKCSASYPEYLKLPSIETQILIDYRYSPKFKCKAKVMVKKGSKTATLQCSSFFNPVPLDAYWEFTVSGVKYKLNASDSQGNFKTEEEVLEENFGKEHTRKYKMTIDKLSYQHFVYYKLTVKNDLGVNTTSIKLEEEPPKEPSGSAVLSWSILTLFGTFIAMIKL